MKMSKILALILALVMVVSCFAACGGGNQGGGNQGGGNQGGGNQGGTGDGGNGDGTNPLAGTYDITVWASDIPGVTDQFAAQIEAFEAANPGIIINATVSPYSEGSASSTVIADPATAPDIYCFAQDQLASLVQAGALTAIRGDIETAVKNDHDSGSIAAATIANVLYAYPLTSDNGYFMYYDNSVISAEDAKDLATIVKKCEDAELKFNFEVENGWYVASFFFGAGCHSQWTMNSEGVYNAVDDDFNSEAGLKAMKAMQILTHSKAYNNTSNSFVDAAVVVTGTWNAPAAKEAFGENLGVAELPSVTVDGDTFHLGSYHGYKLLGVKPQTDAKRGAVLQLLAQYLTGEECQSQRFDSFGWGPSNKVAASDPAVLADPSLAAVNAQRQYSTLQGQIHGSWWDLAAALATAAREKTTVEELQKALKDYEDAIKDIVTMSDEERLAWSVIGNLTAIVDTGWDTDYPMTMVSEGVYESEVLEFALGAEFKLRQGASWDVNIGADNAYNGNNIVVNQAGSYKVRLTFSGNVPTIELIPAE